jgi:hypothetical protein
VTSTCPAGHTSGADDYCDVCGVPINAGAADAGVGAVMGSPPPLAGATGAAGSASGGSGAAAGSASGGSGAVAGSASGGSGGGGAGGAASGSLLDLGSPQDAPGGRACPHCGALSVPGALFCEDCGYDFTTGQLPRTDSRPAGDPSGMAPPPLPDAAGVPPAAGSGFPPAAGSAFPPAAGAPEATTPAQEGPVEWVVEIWVDPEWHAAQEVSEPCPSPGMPQVVPLRGTTQLIGRRSASRNIHPQIDAGADTGVSRRHAQLTTDGQRWWVEDLQSSNGTYVGLAGAGLPDDPVPPGQRTELPEDARLYLGAWTRIVVRPATDEERAANG